MSRMSKWVSRATVAAGLLVAVAGVALAAGMPTVDNRVRGKADAPLTMIEYSDFTCGYCLKFFKETWPKIQARYVDTGKVRFLYKDIPVPIKGRA